MRFAIADPPYPGTASRYKGHADYDGEVDHRELVDRLLRDFSDGWALCTSSSALRSVLILCPEDVHVMPWCQTDPPFHPPSNMQWAWQPVLVRGGRNPSSMVRDYLVSHSMRGFLQKDWFFGGSKPESFSFWLFRCLGALRGDELVDLFPGSGAVGRAWDKYQRQLPPRDHAHRDGDASQDGGGRVMLSTPMIEVREERARQDHRWGEQNHEPLYWLSILGEEFGEVAKALTERDFDSYREELIHLAAVALAMAESFDRGHR